MIAECADAAADSMTAGTVGEGDCLIRLGTATVLSLTTRKPLRDPSRRHFTFCHYLPGRWMIHFVMPGGLFHRWLLEAFYPREGDRCPVRKLYDMVDAEAKEAGLGAGGLLFYPNWAIPPSFGWAGVFLGVARITGGAFRSVNLGGDGFLD